MALRPSRPQSRADQLSERNAAQQDVFVREVDDALRGDQLSNAAKRYGKIAAVALGAGLLGLAGYLWWDSARDQSRAKDGEALILALDKVEAGQVDAGRVALAPLAAGDAPGYSAAAKLMQAGIAAEKGTPAAAANLFSQVSADADAPQAFRDLAAIREIALTFDQLPPQTVVDRLKPLATPGNAWFGNAGELVGMAYLKQGRGDLAGPLFAAIAKDKDAPETLRRRAQQLAGLLGVDAVEDPGQPAARLVAPATTATAQ